jgi:prolyl oligopeptidase
MLIAVTGLAAQTKPMKPSYPPAHTADIVDDYHGTKVADPYRWLEDADDPATATWVAAQNALVRKHLDGADRDTIRKRLAELRDFARTGTPAQHGQRYFVTKNTGLQNQDVLYVHDGLAGTPRLLLDPNTLSSDGTTALTDVTPTDDGALMAYALSTHGSDRQEVFVRDVATGKDLPDTLQWVKFTSISWLKDKSGFYYTRFPKPGSVPADDENYFCQVYFHRLGDPQEKDALIFDRPDDKEVIFSVATALDDRVVVITGYKGSGSKSEVRILDRKAAGAKPVVLFAGFADAWNLIDSTPGRIYFTTDLDAPRGRIVSVTLPGALTPSAATGAGTKGVPGIDGAVATPVVPESADRLESAVVARGHLVAAYLRNASARVVTTTLDGGSPAEIALPAIGTLRALTADPSSNDVFIGLESYTFPPTPFRFDLSSRTLTPFARVDSPVDASQYEVTQVWYPSKDGTKVSMFLVHRKGLARDAARPTHLYGYGGFDISLTPTFDPSEFVFLERGGVYAVANLRGGGEYGEAWHQAGMLEKKQNVFDDFIAAAEWLIANKYTAPARLAIEGGSNGGLLTGAALVQRPDLFGAVLCRVPVADMLRYHRFTVGRYWIPEYGSADEASQFAFLYKYSPLHNVKDGVAYPPTLVMTADTDDRVAPGMAKKFAARLQAATGGPAPILIRIESKAGHGAGKPVEKILDEDADIYTFLLQTLR